MLLPLFVSVVFVYTAAVKVLSCASENGAKGYYCKSIRTRVVYANLDSFCYCQHSVFSVHGKFCWFHLIRKFSSHYPYLLLILLMQVCLKYTQSVDVYTHIAWRAPCQSVNMMFSCLKALNLIH